MKIETRYPDRNREVENEETGRAEFPSARYFQIHFEHMEGLLDETKRCLEALKRQLVEAQGVTEGAQNDREICRIGKRIKKTAPSLTLTCDERTEKPRLGKHAPISLAISQVSDR